MILHTKSTHESPIVLLLPVQRKADTQAWDDSGGRQVHSKLGCFQVVTPQPSVLLTRFLWRYHPSLPTSAETHRDKRNSYVRRFAGIENSQEKPPGPGAGGGEGGDGRGKGRGGGGGGRDRHKGRYCGSCIQVTIYIGTENSPEKF